jgi:hypothetical protein
MSVMEKSSLYPKSYGAWAGNPKGCAPDFTRCCAQVWSRERFARHYQCNKPRGHGPDGAYCKQHDPAVAKARRAAADERSRAQWNNRRYEWHGRAFFDVLVKIADGHNDARGLAQEAIDDFKKDEH